MVVFIGADVRQACSVSTHTMAMLSCNNKDELAMSHAHKPDAVMHPLSRLSLLHSTPTHDKVDCWPQSQCNNSFQPTQFMFIPHRTSIPGFHKAFQNQLRSPQQGVDTILWLALEVRVRVAHLLAGLILAYMDELGDSPLATADACLPHCFRAMQPCMMRPVDVSCKPAETSHW